MRCDMEKKYQVYVIRNEASRYHIGLSEEDVAQRLIAIIPAFPSGLECSFVKICGYNSFRCSLLC